MKTDLAHIATKVVPILRQANVRRCALFGSVARGEVTPTSDVDLLVELPGGQSLPDLVALRLKLQKAVGRAVDVVEYEGLHPLLQDRILGEQVRIL